MKLLICVSLLLSCCFPALANDKHHNHDGHSSYAGQEKRSIKSLSDDDIVELQRGGGWGLAKAAELNGVPGPLHLLELKDKIPLSEDQIEQITALYERMKQQATELGIQLIELERRLGQHFQKRTISDHLLRTSLADISSVREKLRYTHLSAHLETPGILSEEQIQTYNSLRGYATQDPCDNVPAGHNATMWRKHNGCE